MILIIAEKPSVAGEIAKVVGATKKEKGYLSGNNYIVSWCIGHLIQLAKPAAYGSEYEKWSLDSLPIIPTFYITEIAANTASQFVILKDLMNRKEITELVEATDAGREGELIFRLVYDKACCAKPFKRLWISSMEEKSIREGLLKMKDGCEYDNLYQAALCRQRADWLVGMNLTRLYSKMYDKTLTCGRVQTPTINLIVKRQRQIENFIFKTYFSIIVDLGGFKAYTKAIEKEIAQKISNNCKGKKAIVISAEQQEKKENPTPLYDLTTLQRDANRLLGYSAQETLDYMQKLYDLKLSTYPRTDSRYITADMELSTQRLLGILLAAEIFSDKVLNNYSTKMINIKHIINDKKVTDHHAIIPTENLTREKMNDLPTGEKNIMLLIAYRLLSSVYISHTYTAAKAIFDIEGETFTSTGKKVVEIGYKLIEEQAKIAIKAIVEKEETNCLDNNILPQMSKGMAFTVRDILLEEKQTKPLKPFTEDTLLLAMETAGKTITDEKFKEAMKDSGLGTPATRAGIIESIIKIGYIKRDDKKNLIPTETAYTFMDLVTDKIKEPELTAEWEKQLSDIYKGDFSDEQFMRGISDFICSFVKETKALYSPEQASGVFKKEGESIGICPKCGKNVVEYPKAYACEGEKNGCSFIIWEKISNKTISKTQAAKLLTKGKTDLIKGFTSKAGNPFDAYLILKNDKTIGFDFPSKK